MNSEMILFFKQWTVIWNFTVQSVNSENTQQAIQNYNANQIPQKYINLIWMPLHVVIQVMSDHKQISYNKTVYNRFSCIWLLWKWSV